ncbi:integral membrane protein [Ephemerocybe angulata]|uniref:Integral membrane protein n=1 Tax=Ephemerocybe angulata TaxID=980116 RepID=A0A8H6IFR5_9AGAR|nr:integral membrane protein [Tulosesus angulatus]
MPSSLYIPFLLGGMILTGSTNSLWSKWQDMQCVENCADPDPTKHVLYEQPVWQTLQMFLGEMLCFLPVLYAWLRSRYQARAAVQLAADEEPLVSKPSADEPTEQLQGWGYLLFWAPAACDLTATTLMNVGLLYTPVSIYQMTRGALVLFVGVFSVIFLRRKLFLYQWISLIIVMSGVALVGYSGSLIKDTIKDALAPPALRSLAARAAPVTVKGGEDEDLGKVLIGVFLILFAQIFTATQFVVEEKIMGRYAVSPLVAVGFEGLFGAFSVLLLFPLCALPSITALSPFFDLPRGWTQMITTPSVLWSGLAIALSISLFNFFGLSVTRSVSATARSLADTYGTFVFNNLIRPPPFVPPRPLDTSVAVPAGRDEEESEGLLARSTLSLDETAALPADLGQSGFDVVPEGEHAVLAEARARAAKKRVAGDA